MSCLEGCKGAGGILSVRQEEVGHSRSGEPAYKISVSMKEKVLGALRDMGCMLEEADGMWYGFRYGGVRFLYMHNEADECFLNIAVPGIVAVDEGRIMRACALLERINSSLKYVKAYMMGGSVWMFYERELLGCDDLGETLLCMIVRLCSGLSMVRDIEAEVDKVFTEGWECDDDGGGDVMADC